MSDHALTPDQARALLDAAGVFTALAPFDPRFVGSIPLDVHGLAADADIACGGLGFDAFAQALTAFQARPGFTLSETRHCGERSMIARFRIDALPVEIYGRARPVEAHESYVHWLAEHRLIQLAEPRFRADIRRLKAQGLKTEPAFAKTLGLGDDPFAELLKLASPSDAALTAVLHQAGYGAA